MGGCPPKRYFLYSYPHRALRYEPPLVLLSILCEHTHSSDWPEKAEENASLGSQAARWAPGKTTCTPFLFPLVPLKTRGFKRQGKRSREWRHSEILQHFDLLLRSESLTSACCLALPKCQYKILHSELKLIHVAQTKPPREKKKEKGTYKSQHGRCSRR